VGLPSHHVLFSLVLTFTINLFAMSAFAVLAYTMLNLKGSGRWSAPSSGPASAL